MPEAAERAKAPAGVVGDAGVTQAGEDVRRRGWFWHWNSVVTQYTPLLGLKGVGLLNSYTVWTDRREESPHRGYAFPSQQREADFYGEDRAELITINKILVALDLIEIRKEMVLRADPQGRRWRVPHNFYRVKDHHDGFTLSTPDVMRVVELADRDKAVYRYVRRLFSPRFAPIDGDNVWHRIMPELRQNETWQRLAARAEREETKASARTKAGHAARKATLSEVPTGASSSAASTPSASNNDSPNDSAEGSTETSVATINKGSDPGVDTANTGSTIDVAETNTGSDPIPPTSVDPFNDGTPTDDDPTNTTYNQSRSTTTTTTSDEREDLIQPASVEREDPKAERLEDDVSPSSQGNQPAVITGGRAAPFDAPGEASAIQAFEDANARRSTPAERQLLEGLADRFDPAARAAHATGWQWVRAAIYEAVEAGSAFVAPRRLREILIRWEREGTAGGRRQAAGDRDEIGKVGSPAGHGPTAGASDRRTGPEGVARSGRSGAAAVVPSPFRLGSPAVDVALPHGFSGERTWAFTIGLLAETIDRDRLAELVAGAAITGYRDGEVTLAVPDPVRAEQIATTYRDLIARKLGEAMRRPVRLAVVTTASDDQDQSPPEGVEPAVGTNQHAPTSAGEEQPPPGAAIQARDFLIPECGVPNRQVWAAVLAELATRGDISRANLDTWLRPTALIGRGLDGALIIGAPTPLAQRRLTTRFLPDLQSAVTAVTGSALPVAVVLTDAWLREHPDQGLALGRAAADQAAPGA